MQEKPVGGHINGKQSILHIIWGDKSSSLQTFPSAIWSRDKAV